MHLFSTGILSFLMMFSLSFGITQIVFFFLYMDNFTPRRFRFLMFRVYLLAFVFGFSLFSYIHIT